MMTKGNIGNKGRFSFDQKFKLKNSNSSWPLETNHINESIAPLCKQPNGKRFFGCFGMSGPLREAYLNFRNFFRNISVPLDSLIFFRKFWSNGKVLNIYSVKHAFPKIFISLLTQSLCLWAVFHLKTKINFRIGSLIDCVHL